MRAREHARVDVRADERASAQKRAQRAYQRHGGWRKAGGEHVRTNCLTFNVHGRVNTVNFLHRETSYAAMLREAARSTQRERALDANVEFTLKANVPGQGV